jgi:hypothetical protein
MKKLKLLTLYLKSATIAAALGGVGVCVLLAYQDLQHANASWMLHFAWCIYAAAIPFVYALWQVFGLLCGLSCGRKFVPAAIKLLNRIKYAAIAVAVLFVAALPAVYYAATVEEDAPGICLMWLIIIGIPLVAAAAAEVGRGVLLKRL